MSPLATVSRSSKKKKTLSCLHLSENSRFQKSVEFLSCVFESFFVLFVFRIHEVYPSQISCIVDLFWLLDKPVLASLAGQQKSCLQVAWIFVMRFPDHKYLGRGFSLNNVNFLNPVSESGKVQSPSTFRKIVDTLFLDHIQICVSCSGHFKYFACIGNDSSVGTFSNSTSDSIDQRGRCGLQRPLLILSVETHPGFFEVSLLVEYCRSVDSRISGTLPSNSAVPPAIGKMNFSPILDVNISFAWSLRACISGVPIFPGSSMSATKNVSPFQAPPRNQCISEDYAWQDPLTKLVEP